MAGHLPCKTRYRLQYLACCSDGCCDLRAQGGARQLQAQAGALHDLSIRVQLAEGDVPQAGPVLCQAALLRHSSPPSSAACPTTFIQRMQQKPMQQKHLLAAGQAGLDSPGKLQGVRHLVPAWPKAVPGFGPSKFTIDGPCHGVILASSKGLFSPEDKAGCGPFQEGAWAGLADESCMCKVLIDLF